MINRDQQIRQFLEIAQCKSLSKAADALDLTQSGLSKQLASLETFVGQPLFERHGRGVALTDAGRRLHDVAKTAYELVDNAILQLREAQGVTEGILRVATIHTLSYYFMADAMATFMTQRPKVNVTMFGRSSPEVVEFVDSGKADIGFVYDTAVASDAVDIEPLFDQRMCLVVHQGSPLADREEIDLREHKLPLVVFPPQYALRRMLHAEGLDKNVAAEVETVDAMLKLTSVTRGQCVLPDGIPPQLLREYDLTRIGITHPNLVRRVVAITRRGRTPSPLTTLMLDIVRSTIRSRTE
jgi:LysR family cyn operon transcriptional activator